MAYEHTVKTRQVPTSITPPREVDSAIPFFVGCSPINMTGDLTNVNRVNLYLAYNEAVMGEGFVSPEDVAGSTLKAFKFTNSEAIYAAFALKAVAPIMVVNVLDPAKHTTTVATESVTIESGRGVLANTGALKASVVISGKTEGTDYALTWTQEGKLQINVLEGKTLTNPTVVAYSYLDPSKVTESDIIGGIDIATGQQKGIELINTAYSRFGKLPSQLVCAGFSGSSGVAAIMDAKVTNINTVFRGKSLIDIPADEAVNTYQKVNQYKNDNNIVSKDQIALWPMTALGGVRYHASIIQAVVTMDVDAENGGAPYVSPSNKSAPMDSAVLKDGTEVTLTPENTAYLNGQGVCTFLNFDGWRTRGNNTAAYPANTDAKDRFICVSRMFDWIGNTAILTDWIRLDSPINQRLIDVIQNSNNLWLNTLAAGGALVGSQNRVEVLASENTLIDTLNGKITYHWFITPPTPAEVIEHVLEFDVNNLTELFGG